MKTVNLNSIEWAVVKSLPDYFSKVVHPSEKDERVSCLICGTGLIKSNRPNERFLPMEKVIRKILTVKAVADLMMYNDVFSESDEDGHACPFCEDCLETVYKLTVVYKEYEDVLDRLNSLRDEVVKYMIDGLFELDLDPIFQECNSKVVLEYWKSTVDAIVFVEKPLQSITMQLVQTVENGILNENEIKSEPQDQDWLERDSNDDFMENNENMQENIEQEQENCQQEKEISQQEEVNNQLEQENNQERQPVPLPNKLNPFVVLKRMDKLSWAGITAQVQDSIPIAKDGTSCLSVDLANESNNDISSIKISNVSSQCKPTTRGKKKAYSDSKIPATNHISDQASTGRRKSFYFTNKQPSTKKISCGKSSNPNPLVRKISSSVTRYTRSSSGALLKSKKLMLRKMISRKRSEAAINKRKPKRREVKEEETIKTEVEVDKIKKNQKRRNVKEQTIETAVEDKINRRKHIRREVKERTIKTEVEDKINKNQKRRDVKKQTIDTGEDKINKRSQKRREVKEQTPETEMDKINERKQKRRKVKEQTIKMEGNSINKRKQKYIDSEVTEQTIEMDVDNSDNDSHPDLNATENEPEVTSLKKSAIRNIRTNPAPIRKAKTSERLRRKKNESTVDASVQQIQPKSIKKGKPLTEKSKRKTKKSATAENTSAENTICETDIDLPDLNAFMEHDVAIDLKQLIIRGKLVSLAEEAKLPGRKKSRPGRKVIVECSVCGKHLQNENLEAHMRIHTGEKGFLCTYCGKGFNQSSNLKAHMHHHVEESKHVCSLCEANFSRRSGLRAHMVQIHNVEGIEKIHECEYCPRKFLRPSDLRTHANSCGRRHEQSKPRISMKLERSRDVKFCPFCDKRFPNAEELKEHRKTPEHIDKRKAVFKDRLAAECKISCTDCNLEFFSKDLMYKHRRRTHLLKSFECEVCGKILNSKKAFTKHFLRKHRDVNLPHLAEGHSVEKDSVLAGNSESEMPALSPQPSANTHDHDVSENSIALHNQYEIQTRDAATNVRESDRSLCELCNARFDDMNALHRHIASSHQITYCESGTEMLIDLLLA